MGVVERGTATRVQVLGRPLGGKTGTTNKTRDAWFIGFTPSLITGTWVGMDDEHSLGPKETGSQAAAPIFIAYMKEALKGQPVEQFQGGSTPATTLAKKAPEGREPRTKRPRTATTRPFILKTRRAPGEETRPAPGLQPAIL